jgi:signal peptidase II
LIKKYFPLFIVFGVLFFDQSLKVWVKTNYSLGENIFDLGLLRFDFVENPGMAFGFSFGGLISKYLLGVFRLIALFLIGKYILVLIKNKANKVFLVLVCFIFSGALGNIIDNLFYGLVFSSGTSWNNEIGYWAGYSGVSTLFNGSYGGFLEGCVVDMIHLEFYWPSWIPFGFAEKEVFPPVFNVADTCISLSVLLIIVFYKRLVRKEDLDFGGVFKSSLFK